MRGDVREYTNPDCIQFVADMAEAGLKTHHYHGRFWWEGPAVEVDGLQDALSYTKVKCQWDHLGLGWIVYPISQDKGIKTGDT